MMEQNERPHAGFECLFNSLHEALTVHRSPAWTAVGTTAGEAIQGALPEIFLPTVVYQDACLWSCWRASTKSNEGRNGSFWKNAPDGVAHTALLKEYQENDKPLLPGE